MNDLAKLLLRLALGGLILAHGVAKLLGGIEPITAMVARAGLPPQVAWGVYVGEVIAPLLVILGFWSRIGAMIIAINMVFAVALAHRAQLLSLNEMGGYALELQVMFLVTAVVIAMIGPGRYAINGR